MKARLTAWFAGTWLCILAFHRMENWREVVFLAMYAVCTAANMIAGMNLQKEIDKKGGAQ